MRALATPLSERDVRALAAGDVVEISGRVYTGRDKLHKYFADGGTLPADGVFVAIGSAGGADFAKKLGLALNGDSIATDEHMATNAKGIYSCGNVTGGLLQISKAVYEGAVAGLSAAAYVRSITER